MVVAAEKGSGIDARAAAVSAAASVGGGGGGTSELATAGGRNVAAIEEALVKLGEALSQNAVEPVPGLESRREPELVPELVPDQGQMTLSRAWV